MPKNRRSIVRVLGAACAVAGVVAGHPRAIAQTGADRQFPSNEDLRHTRAITDPQLSPDGRFVLVSVTEPTTAGGLSHLWLVDVEQNTSRQLTFGKSSENQGNWAIDGQSVYFTAHRGDHTQLFKLPMTGGEAQPFDLQVVPPVDASTATDAVDASAGAAARAPTAIDVSSYALAPNGALAAIIARDPQTAGEKKQKDDKADAELIDHDLHGSRVYLLDLHSSTLTPVAVQPDVDLVAWSHASDRLIAITSPMDNADDLGPANAAWLVAVSAPNAPTKLTSAPATIGPGIWSGNDTLFFFSAQAEADTPPGYPDLFALALAGGGVSNLSKTCTCYVSAPAIADGDNQVFASVAAGTLVGYEEFAADRPGVQPSALKLWSALGHGVVSQLATNARRTGWVYARADTDQPSALYFRTTLAGAEKRLSLPAAAGDWRAVKAQVVRWKSDTFPIEGLLYLPPEAASRRVPLIVNVHGGPTGASVESYTPFTQFLLGQGWAVLMPNPRGSTGYGAAFAAANKNDLGGGDYRDIMAGVDFAIANYPIDASRLGLMGYSYGGEMAGFVEGKTDRFKGIVSAAPVIDQFSEYGTEGGSWYDRWFFGKPWEHVEDAWRQSPLAGATHAKTPFLLLQGEADVTDPAGQSQEMYRALRQSGVPVDLVIYPRDDHGPLARGVFGGPSAEPWHGFDGRQRIVKFFKNAFGG